MSAELLKCAECGKLAVEHFAVIAVCTCGSRMTEAVPTLPKWNYQERAARAEALAARILAAAYRCFDDGQWSTEVWEEWTQATVAWIAHCDALDSQPRGE